jgi:hypothetical protein
MWVETGDHHVAVNGDAKRGNDHDSDVYSLDGGVSRSRSRTTPNGAQTRKVVYNKGT